MSSCRFTRWLENDFGGLGGAVLLPEVSVGLHRQRAAVGVPEPSRNGRNIDAGLDAAGREQVPQIVVNELFDLESRTRRPERSLALPVPRPGNTRSAITRRTQTNASQWQPTLVFQ